MNKTKYKYIKIVNEGEDYIDVRYGDMEVTVTGYGIPIIKALLKKISLLEK